MIHTDPLSPARRCVTILLPRGAMLSPGAARLLLRLAQVRAGAGPWNGAVAETFRAPRGTLLLLRPAVAAEVAPYARSFLNKYLKL